MTKSASVRGIGGVSGRCCLQLAAVLLMPPELGGGGGAASVVRPFVARGSRGPGGGGVGFGGRGRGGDEEIEDWELQYGGGGGGGSGGSGEGGVVVEEKEKEKGTGDLSEEEAMALLDMEENVLGKEVAGSNWSGGDKRGGGGAFGARQVAVEALQAHAEGGEANASFEDYGDEFHGITDDYEYDEEENDGDYEDQYEEEDEEEEVGEVEAVVDGQVTVDEDTITATTDKVSPRELAKRTRGFFERFRGGRNGRGGGKGGKGGKGWGRGRGNYGTVGLASANTLSALLRQEPAGLYCLRSATKEVYEAYHCSGSFTASFRAEAGVRSLVLDARSNPCCRQATGMCRADGSVFPFNAAYYTTSWTQGRGTSKRRLVSLPEEFDGDASEDTFAFVDDDAEDHEDASPARMDEVAQRELGSKSSKSSKGWGSGRYYWQSYGGPPPPGP
eukprot:CAMPEP_0178649174 /NCGR_PEP_ID=MMETSP0698-20121128/20875_1 /TAXON_ID=265572 /ORGANISM="Extubocellulus spinifer, Strain CCMP396" /LENGTH=444 /DNA_ID=CAMNT_0020290595 /DNA_START=280 /DNA_END=1611 /DNA_ORIENTATION=+